MGAYYKNHLWDMLCCLVISSALSVIIFAGYEISDTKASNYVVIGLVCAAGMAALFAAGYNRMTLVAGIVAAVVLLIMCVVIVRRFHASDGRMIDKSPALFWMVTIGASSVSYLLSRWRIGIAGLLVGGSVLSAAFGFLKYPVKLSAFLLFIAAVLILFLYRVYHSALLSSYTGKVRFAGYTVQSAALVLVIVLVGGLFFAAVIRPLDPPTHPLKLITRLQSLEILQQVGVSRRTQVENKEQSTEIENDDTRMTDQKKEQDKSHSPKEKTDEELQGEIQRHNEKEKAKAVNYHRDRTWMYVLAGILIGLLMAAPFVIRRIWRSGWESKVREAGPTEGSVMIYRYLMKKLRYAGFTRPPEMTLFRYMKGQKRAMKGFAVGSSDMFALTRMYHQVLYGYRELSEADFRRFWKVYAAFRKNMKKKVGKIRYAMLYFLI